MRNLKTFENFEGGESSMNPKEFAEKYNTDYKFIVYVNGKPTSGWEYLSDAIKDGISESNFGLFSEDMMDFEDEMDIALGEYEIDVNDEFYEIDEDELNGAIKSLADKYKYEESIEIRLVDNSDEYPQDYDIDRANDPDCEYHGEDPRFHDHGDEDDLERIERLQRENNNTSMKYLKTFEDYNPFKNEKPEDIVRCNNCEWSGEKENSGNPIQWNKGIQSPDQGVPGMDTTDVGTNELNKETYLDAADKLDNQLHFSRSKELRKHAHKFELGDNELFTLKVPRGRLIVSKPLKFIECKVENSKFDKFFGGGSVIFFIFEDNQGTKYELALFKVNKSDVIKKYKYGTFSDIKVNKTIFGNRKEALKFLDFIQQDETCVKKLEDLLPLITVNSLYIPN